MMWEYRTVLCRTFKDEFDKVLQSVCDEYDKKSTAWELVTTVNMYPVANEVLLIFKRPRPKCHEPGYVG